MFKKIFNKLKINNTNLNKGVIPKKYFLKYLPFNPVIVDAGAADGIDTIEMAQIWSKGTIYAFEPIPKIYEKLILNTKKYKNIKCFSYALSNTVELKEIFVSGGSSEFSSSLLIPKEHLSEHPEVSFSEKIQVQTLTLDSWAEKNNIDKIDMLWLDLQGAEPSVLKASPKILSTVKLIYTEVSLKELYEGTTLYPEFRDWLKKQNFRVEREELAWEDAGNVLFVRC